MQHSLVSIYASSTVVRTPDTVVRGRWAAEGERLVGEQLLLNYRTDNTWLGFQLGIGRFYEPDAVLTSCHADLEEDLRDAIAPARAEAACDRADRRGHRPAQQPRRSPATPVEPGRSRRHAASRPGHLR